MVNRCECGSYNIKVTDSRDHDGDIWRTRVCQDCGKRIYSVEIDRSEYLRKIEIINIYRDIIGLVKMLEDIGDGK